jgi:hypothetical protein
MLTKGETIDITISLTFIRAIDDDPQSQVTLIEEPAESAGKYVMLKVSHDG